MKMKALITFMMAIVLGALTSIQAQEVVRFTYCNPVETEQTHISGYVGGNQHEAMLSTPVTIKFGLKVEGNTYPLPSTHVQLSIPDYREGYIPYTYTAYGQTEYKTVTIPAGQYNYFSFSFNTPAWNSGYVNATFWIEEIVSGNAVIGEPSKLSIIYQK